MSSKLARIRLTLVDLRLAQVSRIPGTALARETILPVDTRTAMARIRLTVIDIRLTGQSRVSRRTFTRVPRNRVMAYSVILTRLRNTIIDIYLTTGSRETIRTVTLEPIYLVQTESAIQTGRVLALVNINLALVTGESWHAHATEGPRVIQTASVILTWMRFALIHIRLATWPRESLGTIAGKGPGRIHTNAIVFARRSLLALVNILGAVDALVPGGTGTRKGTVDRTRVTDGVRMAGIRCTSIVQMAQQSRLTRSAAAHEAAHPIDTGGAIKARRTVTIVNVDAAIRACPPVDTDARVTADRIRARRSVLAHRGTVVEIGGGIWKEGVQRVNNCYSGSLSFCCIS